MGAAFVYTIAQSATSVTTPAGNEDFAIWVAGVAAVLAIISFILVYWNLVFYNKTWTLTEALSEEVEVAVIEDGKVKLDANSVPIKAPQMKASSSRLIALNGMIAILMLYLGTGVVVLYHFALTNEVSKGAADVAQFFAYGMVLFAPYIVNKFSTIFAWLKTGP